jgi:dTDP-4-amino-4,6-dideoxygalactose transaminase
MRDHDPHLSVPYSRPLFERRDFQKLVEPLRCGRLTQGPQVARFEEMVAQHVGARYAVAASSAHGALRLALLAAGVGPGQEVALAAFGDGLSAAAVENCGARPLFCDIEPDGYGLAAAELPRRATPLTTLVIVSHPFGLAADREAVGAACRAGRWPLIEECGGALGASDAAGRLGRLGLAGCYGFGPFDPVTTGEGGMVLTDRPELAEGLRLLRGEPPGGPLDGEPARPGHHLRLTDLQGALGAAQMERLAETLAERERVAARYPDLLAPLGWLHPPEARAGATHGWAAYVCRLAAEEFGGVEEAGRWLDRLLMELVAAGVECRRPARALHTLTYYRKRYGLEPEACPNALAADRLTLALPLYKGMSPGEQERVVRELDAAHERLRSERIMSGGASRAGGASISGGAAPAGQAPAGAEGGAAA